MKVRISDIAQILLAHAAKSAFYLDPTSGELLEKSAVPSEKGHAYTLLPMLAEIQNITICWEYTEEIEEPEIRHELQSILRRDEQAYELPEFIEVLHYHGLEEEWETYKEAHLQDILADWCAHNRIDYTD